MNWMVRLCIAVMCLAVGACGASTPEAAKMQGSVATANSKPLDYKIANSRPCLPPTETELAHDLVPGVPCAISLTRYAGLPSPPGTKRVGHAKVLKPFLLRQLTKEFNKLPPNTPGVYACPNDQGSEIMASLKYPHNTQYQLRVTLSGCAGAGRESVNRSALGRLGERLIGHLEKLIAHHR
jgi:hypothetical protein